MPRVIAVIVILGLLIYLFFRFVLHRDSGEGGGGTPPRKPIAPDDDPRFLRDLDAQLWEQQQERREREQGQEKEEPPTS